MVGYYNQGVPAADMENNSNQKKYTINRSSGKGVTISKPLCALMAIGALLLAILVGLVVFFLVPRYCNKDSPEALTKTHENVFKSYDEVEERLPRSIEPLHYKIRITPDLQNASTSGVVLITLKALEATKTIVFHARNLAIKHETVNLKSLQQNSSRMEIRQRDYTGGDKYKVELKESLTKGEKYVLGVTFNGELNSHFKGFYRSQYNDQSRAVRYIAATQFVPTEARRAFPCFDEPHFKAKFSISLARPTNMTSLANVPLESSSKLDDKESWVWDTYADTPRMSTHALAFKVMDLRHAHQVQDPNIKIWSRENYVTQTQYARELAPRVLRYFEQLLDMKFPLRKIDIVAVPDIDLCAVESWGLATFRENCLLIDPQSSTTYDKRRVATVLSHVLAQQWLGNLVTVKWWNDSWMRKGLAIYLEYLAVNETEPTWKILDEFPPSEIAKSMATDALESARPILFDVKNRQHILQTFDTMSDSKGAALIRMMNDFLGDNVFKSGLRNFLKKHQHTNADHEDLFGFLTDEAHRSGALPENETVQMIMDTWTKKAGFPVVHAVADYDNNKLRLFQKRYYVNGKEKDGSWRIPISCTTDESPDFSNTKPKFWFRGESKIEQDLKIRQWYLLNLNYSGYFVVNYDERNWMALTNHIMVLPPVTRAQLISDSMDLARANLLSYDIPLKMISKMAIQDQDIMFIPTYVAMKKLQFLSDALYATPAFGYFERFHQQIFEKTYQKVTIEDSIDDYITRRIRSTVLEWTCRGSDSRCAHDSRRIFRKSMSRGTSVEPNLRETIYCTAIREGGEPEWDFAYRKYLKSDSSSERNALLDGLGCTKQNWLLTRYIETMTNITTNVSISDAERIFASVAKNKIGTSIAFDFLRTNWDVLSKMYGDAFSLLSNMIRSLYANFNTEFQLSELKRFRDAIKDGANSNVLVALENTIDAVQANIDWMEKNYHQVEEWLRKYQER